MLDSPSGSEFKALVFDYMPSGNLDLWVHPKADQKFRSRNLTLVERVNIAIDVATAINYLHNHCPTPVAHCDLKPSNVLLNENLTAHIADFSLARFLQNINEKGYEDQSSSVAIMGSIGYVPPEYGVGNHISLQGRAYSTEVCREPTVKRIPGRSDRHESLLSKKTRNLGERFEAGLQLILGVGLSCAKVRPSERMDIKDVVILVEVRQFLFH
ncbi:Leucine-rich receptor-like protein kinase family protein [Rhynchospora pubera]|uniref:Leucine-rich receptor-like protein kinase family protein n=1 Tax=Rhynchospora pubera TaxID=906938 RepID=A0AAV8G7W0_9POAL|nr:Leucine-rich receptor-like protein kinase family protein [Rhynchospora pubera]